MRLLTIFILTVVLTFSLLGCSSGPDPAPDPAPDPGDVSIDAKALIDNNCARCHGLGTVYTERDADRWPAIIADMAPRASQSFTEEEVTAMTEYLQENYGK